jgi:RNA polymerase II subunit A small phosphatase-like protein
LDDASKTERKSKGSSKLFSFLSCCGSSELDKEDLALPPKKASKAQPVSGRQSTPADKAEVSAAESSTAESREANPFDEKSALKGNPEQMSQVVVGASNIAGTSVSSEAIAGPPVDESIPPGGVDRTDFAHRSTTSPGKAHHIASQDISHDVSSGVAGGATEIPATQTLEKGTSASGQPPEQLKGDADVAMGDAPLTDDFGDEDSKPPVRGEATQKQPDIPPPPPLDRDSHAAGKQVPPVPAMQPDKHGWLLPPIQPQFQNRKCLVLDLDETLVHSSFKVGYTPSLYGPCDLNRILGP